MRDDALAKALESLRTGGTAMRSPRWAILGMVTVLSLGCEAGDKQPMAPNASLATLLPASDGVRVYQFRTEEDPEVTGAAAFCRTAPFAANVPLNASMWSVRTRASDGRMVNDGARRIGTALACAQITTRAFPSGLQQNFYAKFQLPDGTYTAVGTCTIISNDVPIVATPLPGIVLAGCALKLTGMPAGVKGGAATSLSVFNPRQLPGFATGSQWTIQAYESP